MEKANALIFIAIKKILENQLKGKWVEEFPREAWSHNTSVCRATDSPFQIAIWRRASNPRGNQASQGWNKDIGYLQSQLS
jgi:hypothetical protein